MRTSMRRGALLALTAVSLYLVGPAILDVFSSWDEVQHLDPFLLQLIVIAEGGVFGASGCCCGSRCARSAGPTWPRSQLAATAASRVIPGGGAAANALQYSMLVRGGVPSATAASGLAAAR